jgi:hypothetical protein
LFATIFATKDAKLSLNDRTAFSIHKSEYDFGNFNLKLKWKKNITTKKMQP